MENVKLGQTVKNNFETINNNFAEVQNNYATKTEVTTATNQLYKNVTFDGETGQFTFTKADGSTTVIDTALEKVVTNFTYDDESQSLILTLEDGSELSIPMSAFIDDYTGGTTSAGTIAVSASNEITFTLANGAVAYTNLATDVQQKFTALEQASHTHSNKPVLDATTASYTTQEKNKLAGLNNYTLPVGGDALGGVKNGGNVTINPDGTMNASSGTYKAAIASASFASEGGYYYVSVNTQNKYPVQVMRNLSTGTGAEQVLCSVEFDGTTTAKIGSLEAFDGYVICV